MNGMTREDLVAAIERDPDYWAGVFMEQDQTIEELNTLVEEYKARVEMLMREGEDH